MPMPQPVANPFALMLDPQSIIDRIEKSERLEQLERRVCRPLDKPLIERVDGEGDADGADTADAGSDAQAAAADTERN